MRGAQNCGLPRALRAPYILDHLWEEEEEKKENPKKKKEMKDREEEGKWRSQAKKRKINVVRQQRPDFAFFMPQAKRIFMQRIEKNTPSLSL